MAVASEISNPTTFIVGRSDLIQLKHWPPSRENWVITHQKAVFVPLSESRTRDKQKTKSTGLFQIVASHIT